MEQVKKRSRKNDNSNGRAESSDMNLRRIPILVSEIFLEDLRDVKLLKTCRLVCKSWNIAASKSLNTCSMVSLKENESKLKDFAALLRKRELRSFQHFPSPFQNIRVEIRSFTEPTFINLVFTPHFTCTSLTVVLPDMDGVDLDQSKLSLFLAANKDTLADLIITGKHNLGFQLNEALVNDTIRLTSLKSLKFTDDCNQCTHIQFLENIMRMCSPTYLYLNIRDCESLPSLLQQDRVTNIKELHLFCWVFFENIVTHLANTGFQLRTLPLFQIRYQYIHYPQEWYSFLENVSPSLMQFRTNLQIGNKHRFPKLKEIHFQNYENVLSVLTPENFLSLTKINFDFHIPILLCWENCAVRHRGVQYGIIKAPEMARYCGRYNDTQHEFLALLKFVSRQFPNVTWLDFSIPQFQSSTLTDICKAFARLKTLKLDGECDLFSFAGFTPRGLNQGLPVEMIPPRESILDVKNLEVIKFGSKFWGSPEIIRHCLPRIPKFRQIELYWNCCLSAPLFRDFVGHLDKIVIS